MEAANVVDKNVTIKLHNTLQTAGKFVFDTIYIIWFEFMILA